MFDTFLTALQVLFTPAGMIYLFIGVVVGSVVAVIPGLGGSMAIALLLPLTFGMSPYDAMILMGGVMGATMFAGSIPAILINTPGVAPNAATCFDGYPLAQQGKAGMAIGAAASSSSIGGLIGVAVLIALIPAAKAVVLSFGPPEFFIMALVGLSAIAVSTGSQVMRGLIAAGFGLILAFIGFDNMYGTLRFTLGIDHLWEGINIVPALIGLFAVSEMIKLTREGGTIAEDSAVHKKLSGVMEGVWASFKHWKTVVRGSLIGTIVGIIPGVGGTVASFLAYTSEMQISKDSKSFGKGNIVGVIAPEAANNAKDGGSLVPTLAFGIPGSAEMAVFMGVLILHGMEPGPMLLLHHESAIMAVILSLTVSCVLASIIGLMAAPFLAKITLMPVTTLVPLVLAVCFVGSFPIQFAFADLIVALVFGIIGYFMLVFDYPRITLVIALVLGDLAERTFHQSMGISKGDWSIFVHSGTSIFLLLCLVLMLLVPIAQWAIARYRRENSYA